MKKSKLYIKRNQEINNKNFNIFLKREEQDTNDRIFIIFFINKIKIIQSFYRNYILAKNNYSNYSKLGYSPIKANSSLYPLGLNVCNFFSIIS